MLDPETTRLLIAIIEVARADEDTNRDAARWLRIVRGRPRAWDERLSPKERLAAMNRRWNR